MRVCCQGVVKYSICLCGWNVWVSWCLIDYPPWYDHPIYGHHVLHLAIFHKCSFYLTHTRVYVFAFHLWLLNYFFICCDTVFVFQAALPKATVLDLSCNNLPSLPVSSMYCSRNSKTKRFSIFHQTSFVKKYMENLNDFFTHSVSRSICILARPIWGYN